VRPPRSSSRRPCSRTVCRCGRGPAGSRHDRPRPGAWPACSRWRRRPPPGCAAGRESRGVVVGHGEQGLRRRRGRGCGSRG
jgi:hypothetical protein